MRRCLILANQTLGGPHLIQAVLARQAREPYEFHIVVPATHEHGASMWTEGQAQAHAREALQAALARCSRPATRCGGNRLTRSLSRPCRRARRVG